MVLGKSPARRCFAQCAEGVKDRLCFDVGRPPNGGLTVLLSLGRLNLLIGWCAIDLTLDGREPTLCLLDRLGEPRLIGLRTVELLLHLIDVFALLGYHVSIAVVLGTLSPVAPHSDVKLILHDALACRANCFNGFDLGLDTLDG